MEREKGKKIPKENATEKENLKGHSTSGALDAAVQGPPRLERPLTPPALTDKDPIRNQFPKNFWAAGSSRRRVEDGLCLESRTEREGPASTLATCIFTLQESAAKMPKRKVAALEKVDADLVSLQYKIRRDPK